LLLVRNPEVSPLFGLLVCIYPVFETLFSVWRRYWLRAQPAQPARRHPPAHAGVPAAGALGGRRADARAVTAQLDVRALPLGAVFGSVAPAVLFWDNPPVLGAMILLFAVSYLVLYRRIVRFRSPRWLRRPGGRARRDGAIIPET
jgi:hypothetical protein